MSSLPNKKVEKALIQGMHIRAMISTLEEGFGRVPSVIYIYNKCLDYERKYQRAHPKRYDELFNIFNDTREAYAKEFSKTMISTDTAMTELYYSEVDIFKKYFKLKETKFKNMFNRFGDDDDLENQTFQCMDRLINIIEEKLTLEEWKNWVAENNRKRMKEPVENKSIS